MISYKFSYYYDLCDIHFFIKSARSSSSHFNINYKCQQDPLQVIKLNTSTVQPTSTRTTTLTDYPESITYVLPTINHWTSLRLPWPVKALLGPLHKNFNNDNICIYHLVCPCYNCSKLPRSSKFTSLTN